MNREEIQDLISETLEESEFEINVTEADVIKHVGPKLESQNERIEEVKKAIKKHEETTAPALLDLRAGQDELGAKIESLHTIFKDPKKKATKKLVKAALAAGAASTGGPTEQLAAKFGLPGRAPLFGVYVCGEQGSSKTWPLRKWGQTAGHDRFIELKGFSGMESPDLLGYPDPGRVGKGDAWIDAPLAAAYRFVGGTLDEVPAAVEAGKTCFLLADELNRIPDRERGIFLNGLSPFEVILEDGTTVPCYTLTTGRSIMGPKGVAEQEVLYAPCHLINIFATGNVGMEFNTSDGDPADRERWLEVVIHVDEDLVRQVLKEKCEEFGFSEKPVKALVKIFKSTRTMRNDMRLRSAASIRTLCRILENMTEETKPHMVEEAMRVGEIWCEIDAYGCRIEEQMKELKDVVKGAVNTFL